uniref:Transmembrane protein n=2 Tax=Cacopsylla melanoneura TaxID=428564 RepID=A0A8D8QMC0_9HEMI
MSGVRLEPPTCRLRVHRQNDHCATEIGNGHLKKEEKKLLKRAKFASFMFCGVGIFFVEWSYFWWSRHIIFYTRSRLLKRFCTFSIFHSFFSLFYQFCHAFSIF